jgi:uncharacterized integral membrane protein (TIGR00698 family)
LRYRPRRVRRAQWIPGHGDGAGIGLALATGTGALVLARMLPPTPFLSEILLALLAGVVIVNTPLRHMLGLALPSDEREPDRYAAGLRFTGKWVLRAAIILMGLKVQTQFFGVAELTLIAGVALVALPTAFFVAHSVAALLKVRRPLADLLAGGTMICGASAVNAIAPAVGARREEQGIAIATVFLFSVVALLAYHPIATLLGLDPVYAGLWSGLSVNDLSSAIAVGKQMGGEGDAMATASKSARVLLLAPTLVVFAFLRSEGGVKSIRKSALDSIPRYLFGYIALAALRALGDRLFPGSAAWTHALSANKLLCDLLLVSVAASIWLHLELKHLLVSSTRAVLVGAATSSVMAGLTLAMVVLAARGQPSSVALVGLVALASSFALYRLAAGEDTQRRLLRARFEAGAPLSLAEATQLLDALEHEGVIDEPRRRKLLVQLHPSIGELIPVRESPLAKGEGCRWITYWEGKSGWALVAMCREPGATTPIHAHPHQMLGKSIEGTLEELRFQETPDARLELVERRVLGHGELVETDGLATVHVIRVLGPRTAIDLQLRGPELGGPGRLLRSLDAIDFDTLEPGSRFAVAAEADDRPGHGGEGAAAGRVPAASS